MKASFSSSPLSPWEAHQGTAVEQAGHGALGAQMLDCYSRSTRECLTLAIPMRDLTVSQAGATSTSYRVMWSHMTLLVTLHLSLAQPKGWGEKMPGSFLVCFPAVCSKGVAVLRCPRQKRGVSEESLHHHHRRTCLRISPASEMRMAPGNGFYRHSNGKLITLCKLTLGKFTLCFFFFFIGSLAFSGEFYFKYCMWLFLTCLLEIQIHMVPLLHKLRDKSIWNHDKTPTGKKIMPRSNNSSKNVSFCITTSNSEKDLLHSEFLPPWVD